MSSILPPMGFETFHDANFPPTGPEGSSDEASARSMSPPSGRNATLFEMLPSLAFAASSWTLDVDLRRCFFCDRADSSFGARFRLREAVSPLVSMSDVMPGGDRNEVVSAAVVAA